MNVPTIFPSELGYALLASLILSFAMLILRPEDRRVVRHNLVFLVVCAGLQLLSNLSHQRGAESLASVLGSFALVGIGAAFLRLCTMFIFRVILRALTITTPRIVEDLIFTATLLTLVLVTFRLAGVDLASLITTSAVITAVLAFAMQETLGNILGGVALQLDRSIRIGDWIRIDDLSGRVVEIRWRFSAVETRNRETIYVPNSLLMKNRFMIIGSRTDQDLRWRRWIWLDVAIENPPSQVCAVLERAIGEAAIPHVAKTPPPQCVLMDMQNHSGRYAIRYWLDDPSVDDPTDSQVRIHALAALTRAGMKLGVAYAEYLLTRRDEAYRAAHQAEETARRVAALRNVEIFKGLSEDELVIVAARLTVAPFVKGDTITRQGAIAHWLYLIVSGEADVWIETPERGRTSLSTLQAGNVFGEMGMMTGEPRRATVSARTDVECFRLDKLGFEDIIRARPDLAEEISRVLAERSAQLEELRNSLTAETRRAEQHTDILAKIRQFFGLENGRTR